MESEQKFIENFVRPLLICEHTLVLIIAPELRVRKLLKRCEHAWIERKKVLFPKQSEIGSFHN